MGFGGMGAGRRFGGMGIPLGGLSIPFAPGAQSGINFTVPTYYRTANIAGLRVASGVGAYSEEAYGNSIRNSTMAGLVAGTIGSGGSLPTNWQTANSSSGGTLAVAVAPSTLADGSPAIDVTLTGAPSSAGQYILQFESTTQITCAINDVWTTEAQISIVGGDQTNVSSILLGFIERTAAGGYLNNQYKAINSFLSSYSTLQSSTKTVVTTNTARLSPMIWIGLGTSPVNITLRIGKPNTFLSSKVLSYSSAASRAADAIQTPAQGNSFQIQAVASAYDGTLLHVVDGSSNALRIYKATKLLYAVVATAGVEGTPQLLGRWPDGMTGTIAVTATPGGNASVKFNGKAAVTITGAVTYTTVYVGCKSDGSNQWDGTITTLGQWNGSPVISPTVVGLFDDFYRADGAIGNLWTGQAWAQVPAAANIVAATISTNALVAADSGQATTAAYNGVDCGANILQMDALVSWGAGTSNNGSVTLIANPNGLSAVANITTGPTVHLSFTDSAVIVSVYLSGVISSIVTLTYPTAMAHDGTVYAIGWRLVPASNAILVFMPDGTIASVVDSRFGAYGGRYATFEHFWTGAGAARPSILAAYARTS